MLYIAPYNLGSVSAKALAQNLKVKRITGDKLITPGSVVINWGRSDLRQFGASITVLNKPAAVEICKNKILTM